MSGRRLRVLHVVEAMDRGGAESLLVEHARHAAAEVEVQVCALNRGGPALEAARAAGARTTVLGPCPPLARIRRLAALIREGGADVVNGHNPSGGLYAALAARAAGAPVALRTEHSVHYPGRHSRVYPVLEALATRHARRVICVCEAVRASHAPRFGALGRRFVTVRNGVSQPRPGRTRAAVRAALGLEDGCVAALTVGSLTPQKAQDVLLRAFALAAAALPAARLLVAGDGPLRARLEGACRVAGLTERVRFLGARDDVHDLLAAADLFVLSSRREGLPVTLLEAMAAGRAALATRAGGCGEAIVEGETGRLVAVGDAEALAAALGDMLRDRDGLARMGEAARRRWESGFTAERMVRETEDVYAAALAEAGR